ncbi:Protein rds1 [Mycena kentingensis (nom. inval.)]|nr:Protein rds1 [Mycena kentingensis (nom. inval.)]
MKFFAVVALFPVLATAIPLDGRADSTQIDDTTVLNYALTLEHLENAFYSGALARFTQDDFVKAGLPTWARSRFSEIAAHEKAHVDFLSKALGSNATQACEYNFPYTDPKSFAALSQVLENVGVSAYAGAAQFIQDKSYLTAAAVVLSTEARHAGWVESAVNKHAGWSGALDVPLGLNEVFSLAAPFIKSCPSSNPTLPVKAFPKLTIANAAPGSAAKVTHDATDSDGELNVAFFTGLSQLIVPLKDGMVTIPDSLKGTVYAVLTTVKEAGQAAEGNIKAGPAVLYYPTDSQGMVRV